MKSIFSYHSFNSFLRDAYLEKVSLQNDFTLLDFAETLQISPSMLTQIINRKRGVSHLSAVKIISILGFKNDEADFLLNLVASEHSKSALQKESARQKVLQKIQENQPSFNSNQFATIADWYYLALREACFILPVSVHGDKKNLENFLGLTSPEINLALSKLKHLGIISEQEGFYKPTEKFFTIESEKGNKAIQKFHSQILNLAIESVTQQSPEERDLGSIIFSFAPERLPEAQKLIKEFRRELNKLMSQDPKATTLYCFSSQFFKISK